MKHIITVIAACLAFATASFAQGESSEVKATGKFVMVIDPEKKGIRKTPKVYDPFIKSMTPGLIMIVPLEVAKNKRVYDEGTSVQGINTQKRQGLNSSGN